MKNLYLRNKKPFSAILILFFVSMQLSSKAYQLMSTNFYIVGADGVPTLMDGNISLYDNQYINGVDWNDGTKLNNSYENFGLVRNGVSLVVERRQLVTGADTAFFNMWNMQLRNYRFEVTMQYFDPLTVAAYVWDDYLHTITPVSFSGITTVDFNVTAEAASKAAGRFQLRYTTPLLYPAIYAAAYNTVPVNFTGISAAKNQADVIVKWSVENEVSMENYKIEHSTDGLLFKELQTVAALNFKDSHSYTYMDYTAVEGDNFYRIKASAAGGKTAYTGIAKVYFSNSAGINIYPNPVIDKRVQLQWNNNAAATIWHTSLLYPDGRRQLLKTLNVAAGRSAGSIQLPGSLPAGIYQLQFTDAANKAKVKTIIVL